MKIAVTGLNGFLGSRLARMLVDRQQTVCGSLRPTAALPRWLDGYCQVTHHAIGEPIPEGFEDAQCVVHCAHDFRPGSRKKNVTGTRGLHEAARRAGVSHQIFLSSYSARPDAESEYGRTKFEIEQYFLAEGETVVRPGLVIGNGGLFGRNLRQLLSLRVVPLVDGGRDQLPLLALGDFLQAMGQIIEEAPAGAYNLFNPELVTTRELVRRIQKKAGRRVLFLHLPIGLAIGSLSLAARLGVRLPVDLDNLRALKKNQHEIHVSDLERFVPAASSFDAMLESTLTELRSEVA